MKCYAPIRAYKTTDGGISFRETANTTTQLDIPCQQCIGCRERRASDWEIRLMHEKQLWQDNCAITLTYARNKLPTNGSLDYRDCQLFLKRLRKANEPNTIRYYLCGEYGPQNQRPHYHACIFGKNFAHQKPAGRSESGELYYQADELTQLWGHGRASIQPLNHMTAAYCARYVIQKQMGPTTEYGFCDPETGQYKQREPERALMSRNLGKEWLKLYQTDVYPHDFVIAGQGKRRPPRAYDKILKQSEPATFSQVAEERESRAANMPRTESTPARLTVQETVHKARIANRKRHFNDAP